MILYLSIRFFIILNHLFFINIIDELKKMPAPDVAVQYYTGSDLYLFGKFTFESNQTTNLL